MGNRSVSRAGERNHPANLGEEGFLFAAMELETAVRLKLKTSSHRSGSRLTGTRQLLRTSAPKTFSWTAKLL